VSCRSNQFYQTLLVLLSVLVLFVKVDLNVDINLLVLHQGRVFSQLHETLRQLNHKNDRLVPLINHLEEELYEELDLRQSATHVSDFVLVLATLLPEVGKLTVEARSVHQAMHYQLSCLALTTPLLHL
jgi:3-phosphoglycerate kinase